MFRSVRLTEKYSFIPKIKLEKLVHLVGFIIRIYHDARPPVGQKPFKEFVCRGNDAQQRCFKNADIKELHVVWKCNFNL